MNKVLIIIPTNRCNMECEYCLHHIADEYPRNPCEDMSIETLDKIIADYQDDSVISIQFSGGEPMLNSELLKHYLRAYPQYRSRIFTNGTVLPDDELLQLMKDFPEFEVNLSIDSPEELPIGYDFYKKEGICMYGSAVVDETNLEKNIETFKYLNSLKLARYVLSPNYISPNTKELLDFYKELGNRIGKEIAADPMIDLSAFGELVHCFDVLHQKDYYWYENDHPEVLRFAPDGNYVPSIVHAAVDPSTPGFKNLFSSIIDMSSQFYNAPRDFIMTPRIEHQLTHKTSPSTIYFAHMMYNIIAKMEEKYSIKEILYLFRRPADQIRWK